MPRAPRYTPAELVAFVRAHALNNYETGGWDVVVEAWEDADIVRTIGGSRTEAGAIRKVAEAVGVYDDVRSDVIAAGGGEVQ